MFNQKNIFYSVVDIDALKRELEVPALLVDLIQNYDWGSTYASK